MRKAHPKSDFLVEISWEVCNKVGGISTVIKSKVAHMLHYYNEKYFLIGPFIQEKIAGTFQEKDPDEGLKNIFEKLKSEGINCHYGQWLIKGTPKVILVEPDRSKADDVKKELWEGFNIDSLNSPADYDEPVGWAYKTGRVIELLSQLLNSRVVAHFHEWLAGAGLLYIKKNNVKVATVFTTHATVLGRSMAGNNIDFFEPDSDGKIYLARIDPDEEAYKYKVQGKHQVEKASARNAEAFTTVSEITGLEAEHILSRKPDVYLPNGLDMEKFPTFEERSIKHKQFKNKIREFIMFYFFPHYKFNLDKTLFLFTAARYEFRAKGFDVFISALNNLNKKLIEEDSEKTVVAFFLVPSSVKGPREDLLEGRIFYQDVKDAIEYDMEDIRNNLTYSIISQKDINAKNILGEDFMLMTKKRLMKLKQSGLPSLCSHNLSDPNDAITTELKRQGLTNREEDKVKVVFYPIYLTGADGLLDLDYYETIMGMHLGVFPSFYEPWGYTPLETGALGVSSVTTDLAGFGRYIQNDVKKDNPGIYVIERQGIDDEKVISQLSDTILKFVHLSQHKRIENKMKARFIATLADWNLLSTHYIEAHNLAFDKTFH